MELFCAKSEFDDDIVISYSDIAYDKSIIKNLVDSEAPISVVIDKEWSSLWGLRMEDPLSDVESLRINEDGHIQEIGKKVKSASEVKGQFIGLLKLKKEIIPEILHFYLNMNREKMYDGKDFKNMFMTSFPRAYKQ